MAAGPFFPDDASQREPAVAEARSHPPGDGHNSGTLPNRFASLQLVADAILYEGYVLYPYRQSSVKNRGSRWQFGVISPRAALPEDAADDTNVAGSVESWFQQTDCLLEGTPSRIDIRVRFLQLQRRMVERQLADGTFTPVSQLEADGRLFVNFDEAVPHHVDIGIDLPDLQARDRHFPLHLGGAQSVEPISDTTRATAGRIVRTSWPLTALCRVSCNRTNAPFPLSRLRIRIENTVEDLARGSSRGDALTRSLIATHILMAVTGGRFVSLFDPPEWARQAVGDCRNVHAFPVLGGEPGERDLMLASPIILYDHPQVAPESPADLFDATEIDEILSLRTLTLSDDEKREAKATDPRAAALIDRLDTMPPEVLAKLHGAVRSLQPIRDVDADAPGCAEDRPSAWWEPGADSSVHPESDAVMVEGGRVRRGSLVRLRPRRRGTDAHDMFLAGKVARVEAVFLDVDGSTHVAVTLADDPAADLHQWYGRFNYFAPEELELLADGGAARATPDGEVQASS